MKIAIAGFGIEGKAAFDYWNDGLNELTIIDERSEISDLPPSANAQLGNEAFNNLEEFDMVVRSPSVNPARLKDAKKVWSTTNEFFAKSPARIIGVTGTKGKGTTSSLIASILRAAGKNVHLVGNIGKPALAELPSIKPDDLVVFELSSFQLWDIEKSPHVAVVLGIEQDHLDVHDSMDDYVSAKANIVRYQSENDVAIYKQTNDISCSIGESSRGQKVAYPFAIDEFVSSLKIPGPHNVENASAAIAAARVFEVSDQAIHDGLASFHGLPHRLKFVREVNGVKYYDDSIATTPGSAIAAIE